MDSPPVLAPDLATCLETDPYHDSCRTIPSPSLSVDVAQPHLHPPALHYGGIHPSSIVITAGINAADIRLHGASIVTL